MTVQETRLSLALALCGTCRSMCRHRTALCEAAVTLMLEVAGREEWKSGVRDDKRARRGTKVPGRKTRAGESGFACGGSGAQPLLAPPSPPPFPS